MVSKPTQNSLATKTKTWGCCPQINKKFCSSFVKTFTKKAVAHTLGPLSSLDDPQVVHMLLRLCASFCRVVHLLRGVPIIFCTAAMQEFDAAVRKAFAIGVGVAPCPLGGH